MLSLAIIHEIDTVAMTRLVKEDCFPSGRIWDVGSGEYKDDMCVIDMGVSHISIGKIII